MIMTSFHKSLPMMLHRTIDAIMPAYRVIFARYDLTEQQWRILRVLWEAEKATSMELSQQTLLAPASLVGIIDRLEKKELVTRIRSVKDRRLVYILPTGKGRKMQQDVMPLLAEIHSAYRNSVSSQEWAALEKTLAKLEHHSLNTSADTAANE